MEYDTFFEANNTIDNVKVVCSVENSSAEIFSIFNNATWPSKKLNNSMGKALIHPSSASRKFVLFGGNMEEDGNMAEDEIMAKEFPGGYFGDVSFERITITGYQVATIHPSALLSSLDTLEELEITDSHLKEFPWDTLPLLTKLTSLNLYGNELKEISSIRSDSLQSH
ncbi:unnamed protein product [Darwinula stevensoni]|uniref:Uncharacterized protein n=1 Tax=Darwinula stevensoni TaxID=69355 RepID=A0A7R8X9S6_9CRUS|nr:unnamed protein product [Darwinula stevensoni]CAG0889269.1 unnamed protein product [Darwinula stevensoni]